MDQVSNVLSITAHTKQIIEHILWGAAALTSGHNTETKNPPTDEQMQLLHVDLSKTCYIEEDVSLSLLRSCLFTYNKWILYY